MVSGQRGYGRSWCGAHLGVRLSNSLQRYAGTNGAQNAMRRKWIALPVFRAASGKHGTLGHGPRRSHPKTRDQIDALRKESALTMQCAADVLVERDNCTLKI